MTDRNQKPTDRAEDRERDKDQVKDLNEKNMDAADAQQVKGGLTNKKGIK